MKKYILFFAAAGMIVSCNRLAENEFEIDGKIDKSLDGKKVVLEKLGGYMGFIPVDTVMVQNGKFVFKGTATDPSLHFISLLDKPLGKLNIVMEHGEIDVEFDKDSVYKSKVSGTYNNEKLYEYYSALPAYQREEKKKNDEFSAKYAAEIDQLKNGKTDTVLMNKLTKIYREEYKTNGLKDFSVKFVKENPKAFINIYIIRELLTKGGLTLKEGQELFAKIDPEVKKTKEGKEMSDMLAKAGSPASLAPQSPEGNAAAQAGKPAAGFSAPNPDGKIVSLKESLGKVTIIDFWASWCGPCRKENPGVVALYKEFHSKGLNIIGVSLDDNKESWKKAIAVDNLTWPQVSNLRKWDEPIAKLYGVEGIPATFILDEKGNIVAQNLRGAELKAKVKQLLEAK